MKIILCNIPIRQNPSEYPPFAVLSLIQSLQMAGYQSDFYDIDGLRPSFNEVIQYFKEKKPDLVGISAVVSTSYSYTKKLCLALKEALPGVKLVVGGNMAASAEILHRLCQVDVCGIGEGEHTIVALADALRSTGHQWTPEVLGRIKGITFMNQDNEMAFTGYRTPIPPEEFIDPDFSLLEKFSKIEHFVSSPYKNIAFVHDERINQPHRQGQNQAIVVTGKGCVARCTFCHRWDKGYRLMPPAKILKRIQYLKEKYNVGFFCFGDECFGANRRHLEELMALIQPLDILFSIGGARCRIVDPDLLSQLKTCGCVGLYYGMETGSTPMLNVMEKNSEREHNLQAALWTNEAGLYTIYQLVIGMPGETSQTIAETTDFLAQAMEHQLEPPHKRVSINYIQVLPGTPVYEYARAKGHIGTTPAEEEKYLIKISDVDACEDTKLINLTSADYFTLQTWRHLMLLELEVRWYKRRQWKKFGPVPISAYERKDYHTQGYFNLKKLINHPASYRLIWPVRRVFYLCYVIVKDLIRMPFKQVMALMCDLIKNHLGRRPERFDYRSLRKIVNEWPKKSATLTEKNMWILREGR